MAVEQRKGKVRVLGRSVARRLNPREVAMVGGANGPYDKELIGCETCVTCTYRGWDLNSE